MGDESAALNARKVPERLNLSDTPIGSRLSAHHLYSVEHSPISVKTIQSRNSDEVGSLPCCCTVKEGLPAGATGGFQAGVAGGFQAGVAGGFPAGTNGSPPKPPRLIKYDLNGDVISQRKIDETIEKDISPEATAEDFSPNFNDRPKSTGPEFQPRNGTAQRNQISTTFYSVNENFDGETNFGPDSSDVGINRVTYVVKDSDDSELHRSSSSFAGDPLDSGPLEGGRTSQFLDEGLHESLVANEEVGRRSAPIAKPESIYLDDSLAELTVVRSGLSPHLNMRLPTPEFAPPSAWASESKIFDQMIGPLEVDFKKIEYQLWV